MTIYEKEGFIRKPEFIVIVDPLGKLLAHDKHLFHISLTQLVLVLNPIGR